MKEAPWLCFAYWGVVGRFRGVGLRVYIYICIYIHISIYIYVYIEREGGFAFRDSDLVCGVMVSLK